MATTPVSCLRIPWSEGPAGYSTWGQARVRHGLATTLPQLEIISKLAMKNSSFWEFLWVSAVYNLLSDAVMIATLPVGKLFFLSPKATVCLLICSHKVWGMWISITGRHSLGAKCTFDNSMFYLGIWLTAYYLFSSCKLTPKDCQEDVILYTNPLSFFLVGCG